MQITSKAETYIGFSIKSGKIVWGLDNLTNSRKVKLIIACKTLSENSESKLLNYANDKGIIVYKLIDKTLDTVVNKTNCKVIGLTDKNLAKAVIDNSQDFLKRV